MDDLQDIHEQVQKELKKARQQRLNEYQDGHGQSQTEDYYDSPYTMEDGTATFFYIITMIIGTLFIDRWLIYIAATLIYFGFKNRHKKKK